VLLRSQSELTKQWKRPQQFNLYIMKLRIFHNRLSREFTTGGVRCRFGQTDVNKEMVVSNISIKKGKAGALSHLSTGEALGAHD
jgi:hypothetical protein